jgi:biopolymer transport protein ExbD
MITRPLDLQSKLRPDPTSFDYLFWVNGALIALFFVFFGSRFVLSPGMGLGQIDQLLPVNAASVSGAVPTQLTLNITQGEKLYVDTGFVTFDQLKDWLATQAKVHPGATLLVRANPSNPTKLLFRITEAANAVGIKVQLAGLDRAEATADQ